MGSYAYRLPRRYRYRRRREIRGRDAAVIAAVITVMVAAAGHTAAAGPARDTAPAPGAVPVAGAGEDSFIRAVLAGLGAPATQADIGSLASWFPHEGTAAAYNPMASTMPEPGSTLFNGAGVRNYVSAAQGAQATAATLADGDYPLIVAALRSGAGLCGDTSLAAEFSTWSGGGYQEVC